ncbi:MAG: TRAP transporter small permease [Burkholderiaceae bacterium]|nr:MAG: TRAP transporter small permease [Burkholderiaceae bacterium]TAM02491.1 MAG: TRAP transporter small permease [Pusillimonas sp.]
MSDGLDLHLSDGDGFEETGVLGVCVLVLRLMCSAALLFIMIVTFVDVFMSNFFAAPITGSSEMVMFAMAILIFSSFPLVTLREQHISVGILHGHLSGVSLWIQRLVVLGASFLACTGMAWQLLKDGIQLSGEQQATMVLQLPLGPLDYFMSALSAVSALALVLLLLRHLITPMAHPMKSPP